jgi:hypothetical protein
MICQKFSTDQDQKSINDLLEGEAGLNNDPSMHITIHNDLLMGTEVSLARSDAYGYHLECIAYLSDIHLRENKTGRLGSPCFVSVLC